MNPSPPILQNIRLATSNVRSVHNKSAGITDLVISKKLDILALIEISLIPHDTTSYISDICPLTIPVTTNHVTLGVEVVLAFWYPISLKGKSHSVQIYSSFEAVCIELSNSSFTGNFLCLKHNPV